MHFFLGDFGLVELNLLEVVHAVIDVRRLGLRPLGDPQGVGRNHLTGLLVLEELLREVAVFLVHDDVHRAVLRIRLACCFTELDCGGDGFSTLLDEGCNIGVELTAVLALTLLCKYCEFH